MPKRRPFRPQKMFGNIMVSIVLSMLALAYYVYVGLTMFPKYTATEETFALVNLIVFHVLFGMLLWSFF